MKKPPLHSVENVGTNSLVLNINSVHFAVKPGIFIEPKIAWNILSSMHIYKFRQVLKEIKAWRWVQIVLLLILLPNFYDFFYVCFFKQCLSNKFWHYLSKENVYFVPNDILNKNNQGVVVSFSISEHKWQHCRICSDFQ